MSKTGSSVSMIYPFDKTIAHFAQANACIEVKDRV